EQLQPAAEFAQVDGNRCPNLLIPSEAIVKGDLTVPCISAASILAKVSRDREMEALDSVYPGYGLAQHKGYPTQVHMDALKKLGPSPIHRRSFGPVAALVEESKGNPNSCICACIPNIPWRMDWCASKAW